MKSSSIGRRLALAAGSAFLSLLVLEGGFRAAGFGHRLLVDKVPELGWRLAPDQHALTDNGRPIHVNALGFRDEEFPARKPPNEWRVLVVGDSLTFGMDVDQDSPFPRRMHRLLATRRGPPRVRVVNGGVPGYDVEQYRLFLERIGFGIEPDVVLVAFFPNDIEIAPRPEPFVSFPGRDLIRRSALVQGLESLVRRLARPADTSEEARRELDALLARYVGTEALDPELPEWRRRMRLAREVLRRIERECERRGARLGVLLLPAFVHTEGREPNKVAEKLASFLKGLGVPHLDLTPVLAPHHPDCWLPHDPGHFSDLGHRVVAEAAVRFLEEQDLLPQAGTTLRNGSGG